jgi:hypothetical protein
MLTTFTISFNQIREQSPLADSILRMIACIAHQEIPHALLASLGDYDEICLTEALANLHNFSLLQVTSECMEKSYTVHSLVHLAIQDFLAPEERSEALKNTAICLLNVIPETSQAWY